MGCCWSWLEEAVFRFQVYFFVYSSVVLNGFLYEFVEKYGRSGARFIQKHSLNWTLSWFCEWKKKRKNCSLDDAIIVKSYYVRYSTQASKTLFCWMLILAFFSQQSKESVQFQDFFAGKRAPLIKYTLQIINSYFILHNLWYDT